MNRIHACLCVKMNTDSSFHLCGGPVKLLQASLCVRKDVETSFHHCGETAVFSIVEAL